MADMAVVVVSLHRYKVYCVEEATKLAATASWYTRSEMKDEREMQRYHSRRRDITECAHGGLWRVGIGWAERLRGLESIWVECIGMCRQCGRCSWEGEGFVGA